MLVRSLEVYMKFPIIICHFLFPGASGSIRMLDLRIVSEVFYHYAIRAQQI